MSCYMQEFVCFMFCLNFISIKSSGKNVFIYIALRAYYPHVMTTALTIFTIPTTAILFMGMLSVKYRATNTKKEQKTTKREICTIIFSIKNSLKINLITLICALTDGNLSVYCERILSSPMTTLAVWSCYASEYRNYQVQ